jgi:hypothetical protein
VHPENVLAVPVATGARDDRQGGGADELWPDEHDHDDDHPFDTI